MKKIDRWMIRVFVPVMLCFSLLMAAYVVIHAHLDFQLEDVERSLETSRGRERKQQFEYDETVARIPLVRQELDRVIPMAEEAVKTVQDLKNERKELRERKKNLQESAEGEKE